MSLEQIKSGLKLLRSAERGITSDGQRVVSPKTAEIFFEVGQRKIIEGIVDLAKALPTLLGSFEILIRQGEENAESSQYFQGHIEAVTIEENKLKAIKLAEYPDFLPYHPNITLISPLLEEQPLKLV